MGGRRVFVAGSAMESGKTTCCIALAAELRARGVAVVYEKKTRTASMRDPLRVALGRYEVFGRPGAEVRACASSDAAFHAVTFLRATYGFRLAFSGPLGADDANAVLRDEVESRLGVPRSRRGPATARSRAAGSPTGSPPAER